MSAILFLPFIQSIVALAVVDSAAVKLGGLLQSAFGPTARLPTTVEAPNATALRVEPVSVVRSVTVEPERTRGLRGAPASSVEERKAAAVASLAARPYLVEPTRVRPAIEALRAAQTIATVERAHERLTELVEASHTQVFTQGLTAACERAAIAVGFDEVQVIASARGPRVVAKDAKGRALVTEIQSSADRMPSLETEVLGSRGRACEEILTAFDEALAAQGVQGGARERRSTGGVAMLAAARDLLGGAKSQTPARPRAPARTKVRLG
jgi:hypothetical protein